MLIIVDQLRLREVRYWSQIRSKFVVNQLIVDCDSWYKSCWASNHEVTQRRPTCNLWGLTTRCFFLCFPWDEGIAPKCCLKTMGVHCKHHFQGRFEIFTPQQGTVNIQSLIGGDAPAQWSILMTQPWHHRTLKTERALKNTPSLWTELR